MPAPDTPPSTLVIRRATIADVPYLTNIHAKALPEDLLPRLGEQFLNDTFYATALVSPLSIVLLAELDGNIVGFNVVALESAGLTRLLTKDKFRIITAMLTRLWADPGLLASLVAMSLLTHSKTEIPPQVLANCPEIYAIAVLPGMERRQIGSSLVREGIRVMREARKDSSWAVVKTTSPDALRFYEKQGFRLIGAEYRGRRGVHVLVHPLTP